jgi:hypothetical protein
MQAFIRSFPAVFYLLLVSWPGSAADTLKIHLVYKHRLDDTGRSLGFTTIDQKFYTPGQVLFRDIRYDEKNGQISGYTFYFYTGGKLSSEECYNQKDSLMYILRHDYDASGRESQVVRLIPADGNLKAIHRTTRAYDKQGNMIRQKEYSGNKTEMSAAFEYIGPELPSRESRKFKQASLSPVKSETRTYLYNSNSSVKQVVITGKDKKNRAFKRIEDYIYNDKGLLTSVNISGPDFPDGLVKTYKYLDSGTISVYQESNAAGRIGLMLQYDYKKHYMDPGTQVSYLSRKK